MMVLGGLIPALELKGLLAVLAFPDEGQGLYNTLVGLLLADNRHFLLLATRSFAVNRYFG